jgi:transcription initiation factor TFIIE subunit beta
LQFPDRLHEIQYFGSASSLLVLLSTMSSLDAQLAAFKQRAQAQPVLPRAVVRLQPPSSAEVIDLTGGPSTRDEQDLSTQPPKKRQKASVVYSQPKDTGMGQHLFTQLTYAVDYLKTHSPITAEEIARYLSTSMTPSFLYLLRNNPKITYNADSDLYEFRPLHNIRNASSLLATLANTPTGAGLVVKELKDGYPNIEDDLKALEAQGKVLVMRGKKDGLARMVWYNDPKLNVSISDEFKDLFHSLKVPDAEDLPKELEKAGMTPASVDPRTIKHAVVEKEKKRKGRRRGKITNTHLVGIFRDYSERNS